MMRRCDSWTAAGRSDEVDLVHADIRSGSISGIPNLLYSTLQVVAGEIGWTLQSNERLSPSSIWLEQQWLSEARQWNKDRQPGLGCDPTAIRARDTVVLSGDVRPVEMEMRSRHSTSPHPFRTSALSRRALTNTALGSTALRIQARPAWRAGFGASLVAAQAVAAPPLPPGPPFRDGHLPRTGQASHLVTPAALPLS
jgi:hypothetical protein